MTGIIVQDTIYKIFKHGLLFLPNEVGPDYGSFFIYSLIVGSFKSPFYRHIPPQFLYVDRKL